VIPEANEEENVVLTAQEELNLAFLDCLIEEDLPGMQKLLEAGASVNHHNPGAPETPLHFAVSRKEGKKFVDWLLSKGAKVNAEAEGRMTPLHFAVRLGQVDVVESLVQAEGIEIHPRNDAGIVPYYYTTKRFDDCVVSSETRTVLQKLLPNPPTTNILALHGPVVFGKA